MATWIRVSAFLFLLVLPVSVHAENIQKPFLFAVQRDGKVSFLLGTQHKIIPLTAFPSFVLEALNSRPLFAAEIIPDPKPATPKKTPPLENGPVPSEAAAAALRARGVPEYLFRSPYICSTYINWQPGYPKAPFLDKALTEYAANAGKVLVGLDSPEDLEKLRASDEKVTSKCDIEKTTKYSTVEKLEAADKKSWDKYSAGDLSGELKCGDAFLCAIRTNHWLPAIQKLHASGGVFAAMGLMHLAGEKGLIELLRKAGYSVEQVGSKAQLDAILANP